MEQSNSDWNMLPEDEAKIELVVADATYELRPDNTEVYTHVGRLALYNCIFHAFDDGDSAMYVFSEQEGFIELATLLVSNGFPTFVNMREVEPWIKNAYERRIMDEVFGGIPDGLDFE